jgi:hypothetical protein
MLTHLEEVNRIVICLNIATGTKMYTENKENKANQTYIIYVGIILVRKSMKITYIFPVICSKY